jgi:16S rRNA C967 or C1407 C5-methylase (RsmB/RsmF family)
LQYLHQDGPLGMVVSNDLSKQRLMATGFNLNRMGIFNSIITNFNGFSFGKNLPEFFDKVLLDAPCSGE